MQQKDFYSSVMINLTQQYPDADMSVERDNDTHSNILNVDYKGKFVQVFYRRGVVNISYDETDEQTDYNTGYTGNMVTLTVETVADVLAQADRPDPLKPHMILPSKAPFDADTWDGIYMDLDERFTRAHGDSGAYAAIIAAIDNYTPALSHDEEADGVREAMEQLRQEALSALGGGRDE